MGLGGYLCWTAVAREIRKRGPNNLLITPVERHGNNLIVKNSEIFIGNNDFCLNPIEHQSIGGIIIPLILNDPLSNYCKIDTPQRATHRFDKHIIEQYCEPFGIMNPDLKCYLTPDNSEFIDQIIHQRIGIDDFLTIEPYSNTEYTINRQYPFDYWQKIVNVLRDKIKIVQVGVKNKHILDGAIDMTGITTFKNTAGIIGKSKLFLSTEGGLVHAATAFNTKSIVIITGYQAQKMIAYPQNINIFIGRHGPCGLKTECSECIFDAHEHDYKDIVNAALCEI